MGQGGSPHEVCERALLVGSRSKKILPFTTIDDGCL